ncbi:hypothetical protein I6G96_09555 [Delftia acidovorans]|uniref:tetratricopeptide repeat protein n=1 Tax=Delftia acidovorans TaxID=80866 RepID=UPI0018D7714A|nr:hypothetical protein [Delftia acidovorans]QPR36631.1 hypothetical protein I6G96_09555 [Delftia acidovorans]
MLRRNAWIAVFWLALLATFAIYLPGLKGGFLFDDAPNLSPMGAQGGISDWETFQSFVMSGSAGPLGRPVALASFLLDDFFWPSQPSSFKLTNLWLHLLTGLMLCWSTLNLLRLYGISESRARWAAVLNMAFWLLHPYMLSTTLYVVQRMAQLATLFMLCGLAGYLHGRLLLQRRPTSAYLWMSISLTLGTLLAAFSKENGILLPMLAGVIECCMPSRAGSATPPRPDWRWRLVLLWLPSLAVAWALSREINLSANAWPTRPFNQLERLLTEPRILWEYLFHLYVPRIEGRGLFQDGYVISTGLLQPWTTLPSLLGVAALLVAAIGLRKRLPYVALAILFFFASHLIESTVVGLELYFEHRNYGAALFLFLPLIMALLWVAERKSLFVATVTLIAMLVMLAGLTWQRASLWSDTDALQNYWAANTPESARAQNHLAIRLFQHGQVDEGFALLESATQHLPQSSLLTMQWLLQKVLRQQATTQDFERVRQLLPQQRFDAQTVLGMRLLTETLIERGASGDYQHQALVTLSLMQTLPQYAAVPLFNRLEPYLRGLLLTSMGRYEEAQVQLLEAIDRYRDIEAALSMVAHMGSSGHPREGLQLLDAAQKAYGSQPDRTLRRSRATYDMEIARLRQALLEDLQAVAHSLNEKNQP